MEHIVEYIGELVNGNQLAVGMILSVLLGAVLGFGRSLPRTVAGVLLKQFTTTVTLHSSAESFHLLIVVINNEGSIKRARTLALSNGLFGGEPTRKKLGIGSHLILLFNKWCLVTVEKVGKEAKDDQLTLRYLGRDHKFIDELVSVLKDNNSSLSVFKSSGQNNNDFICDLQERKMESVFISEENKDRLLKGLDTFLASKEIYAERGISYQFNILLHGIPGCGKTSLIRAIATHLRRDVQMASILHASAMLGNARFISVFEEIDMALNNSNRHLGEKKSDKSSNDNEDLTLYYLKALTEYLDGVTSSAGKINILTTNNIDALDKALLRPGRMDLIIELSYLTRQNIIAMISVYHKDTSVDLESFVYREDLTGAYLQSLLLEKSLVDTLTEIVLVEE